VKRKEIKKEKKDAKGRILKHPTAPERRNPAPAGSDESPFKESLAATEKEGWSRKGKHASKGEEIREEWKVRKHRWSVVRARKSA